MAVVSRVGRGIVSGLDAASTVDVSFSSRPTRPPIAAARFALVFPSEATTERLPPEALPTGDLLARHTDDTRTVLTEVNITN